MFGWHKQTARSWNPPLMGMVLAAAAVLAAAVTALSLTGRGGGDAPQDVPVPSAEGREKAAASGQLGRASDSPPTAPPVTDPSPNHSGTHSDAPVYRPLIGRWRRPDGGYILDIRALNPDGELDAAYRNPQEIHVAKAEASVRGGRPEVLVELRDRNYPGNYYTLTYDPDADRLSGVYHHLGVGQDFDVVFTRLSRDRHK
jgi:hypothetical protein